ncbi:DUF4129 domain-containing protein [Thermoactinospora rubra]|uniref:DUF4129 domain-containing protein n=1 Tax=Thermoactinospora rubra TaxID=1088767 RepID=UPI000A10AF9A|nr:DUF4129 domain-containing protein [Thermoactinospora rubra]
MTAPPIGREEAGREAAGELLKPGYEHESPVDELWRRLQQFLGDLMDAAGAGGQVGGLVAAALILLIVVAAVFLVAWALRKTSRARAAGPEVLFGERLLTAAEHRANAERLAAEGSWAQAIRERLRAIVRDLEERAIVDRLQGRTADELAAEAGRALPEFAAELATAARIFDDVTYGDVPGTADAYGVLAGLDDRLRVARPVPLGAGAAPPGGGPGPLGTGSVPPGAGSGGSLGGGTA